MDHVDVSNPGLGALDDPVWAMATLKKRLETLGALGYFAFNKKLQKAWVNQ